MVTTTRRLAAFLLVALFHLVPTTARADDIDIFAAPSNGAPRANVMIVLDNTANYSNKAGGWPGGIAQGQAEMRSIKALVESLSGNQVINLGLMIMSTASGNPGGMVVFAPAPMVGANLEAWKSWLDARDANITDSAWKLPSSASYGPVMFDLFKFFGGYTEVKNANNNIAGTPIARIGFGVQKYADIPFLQVDARAYTLDYQRYVPPANSDCTNNYVIFIGNTFPDPDDLTLLQAVKGDTTPVTTPFANTLDSGSKIWLGDEWARFMAATDVSPSTGKQSILMYTINVYGPNKFNAQQATYLGNMAGDKSRAFNASSDAAILSSLQTAILEIQSVNASFASVSLPINTSNRAQSRNQVYVPMFRADSKARPLWPGNLKKYNLIDANGSTVLGDANGAKAIEDSSNVADENGLFKKCAVSFWTTDSGSYWSKVKEAKPGQCVELPASLYSDKPDADFVERGGVAENLRKGNNPPTTDTTPTYSLNRTIYTMSYAAKAQTGSLVPFNVANTGLSASLVDFISGKDTQDENSNKDVVGTPADETRASIHGDVVHSRPASIEYSGGAVTVFYGANDGMLRAVDGATGKERWALVAPEFFTTSNRLQRLQDNSPVVSNFVASGLSSITPTPLPKDYFFDGAIGVYQPTDGSKVYIYPTTRRGGRMVYALDVTSPGTPVFKWRFGCPSLTSDQGCTDGSSAIGQTWSKPLVVQKINGYANPVVIFGGGHDNCEDANTAAPACGNEKGAVVYVLDAESGALVASFATPRAVVADIALLSSTNNGVVDTAYAADTGGNITRIDFKATVGTWTSNRIAYTNTFGRKFLFAPALLLSANNKVYLAIGSGDREHPLITHYPYTSVTNRFYVFVDDLSVTPTQILSSAVNLDDTKLMNDNTTLNSCSTTEILPSSTIKGYFITLNGTGNDKGEQTVTSALIAAGQVMFSTNRPTAPKAGTCAASLGEARGYRLNLFNGSGAISTTDQTCGAARSSAFIGGGLPASPVLAVVPVTTSNGSELRTVVFGAIGKCVSNCSSRNPIPVEKPKNQKRRTVYWKSNGLD